MCWEVQEEPFDMVSILARLEKAWGSGLEIMLFADGSGRVDDWAHEDVYFQWDSWGEFVKLMQDFDHDPRSLGRLSNRRRP